MTIREVAQVLEELAPLNLAEEFDNVGLLLGDMDKEINGVLVTLDSLENVVEEAIDKGCDLIVSFHPIIFKGLKRLNGSTYVERTLIKAIRNDIAIYSMHTALDNSSEGVNAKICEVLNLSNTEILIPKTAILKKLVTYVPEIDSKELLHHLFEAGAGSIGNYSNCSFSLEGMGSYTPKKNARPYKGSVGKLHLEKEIQINVVFTRDKEKQIIRSLKQHHPYEEIAYEVSTLDNTTNTIGIGRIGELSEPMDEMEFMDFLKEKMQASVIRHSDFLNKKISRVAVLGGSGAFAISHAKQAGADILITSDIKYHEFYQAEGQLIIADIGHYETEQFTKNLLVEYLTKKLPNFAISLSESITNPIKYY